MLGILKFYPKNILNKQIKFCLFFKTNKEQYVVLEIVKEDIQGRRLYERVMEQILNNKLLLTIDPVIYTTHVV